MMFHSKSGRENKEILAFAKQEHIDIIAMDTLGNPRIEDVFFESVAEKVLRHSPLPVFKYLIRKSVRLFKKVVKLASLSAHAFWTTYPTIRRSGFNG